MGRMPLGERLAVKSRRAEVAQATTRVLVRDAAAAISRLQETHSRTATHTASGRETARP